MRGRIQRVVSEGDDCERRKRETLTVTDEYDGNGRCQDPTVEGEVRGKISRATAEDDGDVRPRGGTTTMHGVTRHEEV